MNSLPARLISLLAAAAVVAVIVGYPRLIAHDGAHVPFPFLAILLCGMSAAWVHGFGFIPEHRALRIIFSPLVAWPLLAIGAWGTFLH